MIITGTMDAAVSADKIGRHKLAGITLTEGTKTAAAPADDDEECGGFVFITDAQAAKLAGITVRTGGRTRALAGVGVAVWLQRTMGPADQGSAGWTCAKSSTSFCCLVACFGKLLRS